MAQPIELSSGRRRILMLLAMAVMFLAMTVNLMLGPLLADLAKEFNTSVAVTGQLAAITLIAWVIIAPAVGPFSDTYGRRRVMLLGATLVTVGSVASGLAWDFGSMAAFRLVSGAGAAMIPSSVTATLSDIFPATRRGRALGGAMTVGNVAGIASLPLVALVADVAGWRWSFFMVGILWGLLLIPLLLWFSYLKPAQPGSLEYLARFKALVRQRDSLFLLGANVMQRMGTFGVMTYLAAYLMESYGLTKAGVALPLSVAASGMAAGSLLGSDIATRRRRLLLVPMAMAAASLVGGFIFWSEPGAWASAALAAGFTFIHYMVSPTLIALMADLGGPSRATAFGLFGASNQMGGVIGSSLGGLVLAMGGFPAMGFLWLGAGLTGAALVRLGVREARSFVEMKEQERIASRG